MPDPTEKLARSLEVLRELQGKAENPVIRSSELPRIHRERLEKQGFIKKVIRGWYISTPPDEQEGDSSSWFASYWGFCARYLKERYGDEYCLSAEDSLRIHAGNWSVPHQLIVRTKAGTNRSTPLPFNTSLFSMSSPMPDEAEVVVDRGLRLMKLPYSLIHCSPGAFKKNPTDMRAVLVSIKDPSEILKLLLDGGHTKIAGRLAGAFRNIGRERVADDIVATMQKAGSDVREQDPFEDRPQAVPSLPDKSPGSNRIRLIWSRMRPVVIEHFPKAPGLLPEEDESYLKKMDEIYTTDAYHSLSIERYQVTPDLIERVRSGVWDPDANREDKKQRDAMAARGYWQAFQRVKYSVQRILKKENAGRVVEEDHGDWYQELFAPSVSSGLVKPSDLAGYRNEQVYIGKSRHVPMPKEAVRDAMSELFHLLRNEEAASVRAVLGHFLFVYIHPYMDGNGRMGRFIMNVMLASEGYPWTVIPVEERNAYMNALEAASTEQNIEPFVKFISWLVEQGSKGAPVADAK